MTTHSTNPLAREGSPGHFSDATQSFLLGRIGRERRPDGFRLSQYLWWLLGTRGFAWGLLGTSVLAVARQAIGTAAIVMLWLGLDDNAVPYSPGTWPAVAAVCASLLILNAGLGWLSELTLEGLRAATVGGAVQRLSSTIVDARLVSVWRARRYTTEAARSFIRLNEHVAALIPHLASTGAATVLNTIVLALINPPLGVALLAILALDVSLRIVVSNFGTRSEAVARRDPAAEYLEFAFRELATVKSSGAELHVVARWRQLLQAHSSGLIPIFRRAAPAAVYRATDLACLCALIAAARLVGAWYHLPNSSVIAGAICSCLISAAVHDALKVLHPIGKMRAYWRSANALLVVCGSPVERLESPPRLGRLSSLALRDVAFRSETEAEPLFSGVSLRIRKGEVIGITGDTGSGKSTLALLLLGLLPPTDGRLTLEGVRIDGTTGPANAIDVGAALQDECIISASVYENLQLGNPGASEAHIAQAAELTGLSARVRTWPGQYKARVECGLDPEDRALIAVTRAFVRRPAAILLDECTDRMRPFLQRRAMAAIRVTADIGVVVTRNSACLSLVDRVLVVDRGRVVEQDSKLLCDTDSVECG